MALEPTTPYSSKTTSYKRVHSQKWYSTWNGGRSAKKSPPPIPFFHVVRCTAVIYQISLNAMKETRTRANLFHPCRPSKRPLGMPHLLHDTVMPSTIPLSIAQSSRPVSPSRQQRQMRQRRRQQLTTTTRTLAQFSRPKPLHQAHTPRRHRLGTRSIMLGLFTICDVS